MRELLRKALRRFAPGAYSALERMNRLDLDALQVGSPEDLKLRLVELEKQVFELREENRRVTELYDLVIERLREDNPLRGA